MEQKQNAKLVIIVIVVAVIIFVLWDVFFLKPLQKQQAAEQQATQQVSNSSNNTANTESSSKNTPSFFDNLMGSHASSENVSNTNLGEQKILNNKTHIKINTQAVTGFIDLQGARVDSITLKKYKQTTDKNSDDVTLLHPKNTKDAYFYESGFTSNSQNIDLPTTNTLWHASSNELTVNNPVTLTFKNSQGIIFKKIISIDSNYMLQIQDIIVNHSGTDITIYPWAFITRHGEPQIQDLFISHEGIVGYFNNENQQLKYKNIKADGNEAYTSTGGYFGFADKYFMVAIAPNSSYKSKLNFRYFIDKTNVGNYQADYIGNGINVSSSQSYSNNTKLFVGPKDYELLNQYSKQYNIPKFADSIDFGWFYFITKPFLSVLLYIDRLLGSEFAYAMLLFTILIRLVVFPITYTSYASMAKMRKIQPQMKELKEKHAGDPQKYNQAIMGLYKKEKVNPLAGCLPLIIQIPILFSIYKVIYIAVEMRQAPFLWIKDLSAADPTSVFNLFGLLPYTVPGFLEIGFWAILMGVTMFLQQKLSNTTFVNETQKKLMTWFPVIMVFVLAKFPAGLLIYWCWSNIISIIQQVIINYIVKKRHGHH